MIRLSQDRVGGGESDEMIEGCSAFRRPDERYSFLKKV